MSSEIVTTSGAVTSAAPAGYTAEHVDLIKSHVMQSVKRTPTDVEFQLFIANCQRTGLDPLLRQIYCIERNAKENGQWVSKYSTQISIDGARLVAERTGRYEGQIGPLWCGADGQWQDVWPFEAPPLAAKVGVWKASFREPLWGVAHYAEYVQTTNDGRVTRFWERMPALMLAKCAEALALRKAFPHELSGLYTAEEMGQAQNDTPPVETHGKKPPSPDGARARFFTKWGARLEPEGSITWADVRGALQLAPDTPEPTTVAGWVEADRLMAEATAEPTL